MASSKPGDGRPQSDGVLGIVVGAGGDEASAAQLAQRAGISIIAAGSACCGPDACTARGEDGLPATSAHALSAPARDQRALIVRFGADGVSLEGNGMVMRPDLSGMAPRLRPGRLSHELLVRAAKLRRAANDCRPIAVDATAGLGEDALLLAAVGFDVLLFEQDPVIAALLEDSLRRAAQDARLAEAVSRMHLAGGDSIPALPQLDPTPDVVYLDPMFPARRKRAAVKKKFQLIHELERPCENQEELVAAALATHPRKVVIKRPVKGPYLAGKTPSYTIVGKAVRYDCLVP